MDNVERIPGLVSRLYEVVAELEELFPERRFTLDGHLVGSIGEVLAKYHYGLVLLSPSREAHDARTEDGRNVQIKMTQGTKVALRGEPDYLIVLRLEPDGTAREVFNGPGHTAWEAAGRMQRNGQRSIGIASLRNLMTKVEPETTLSIDKPFPD